MFHVKHDKKFYKPIDNFLQYVYNKLSFFDKGLIMQQILNIDDTLDTFPVYQVLRCAGYSKIIAEAIESIAYEIDEDHREYNIPRMTFLSFFRFLDTVKKGGDLNSLCDDLGLSDFVKHEIEDQIKSVKVVNYSRVFDLFN